MPNSLGKGPEIGKVSPELAPEIGKVSPELA
jgi:hypothetical protein